MIPQKHTVKSLSQHRVAQLIGARLRIGLASHVVSREASLRVDDPVDDIVDNVWQACLGPIEDFDPSDVWGDLWCQ